MTEDLEYGGVREGEQASLSVSDALQLAKQGLESIHVRILGEVSEVSNKAGYKAVYFTVKDERSSLPCMIWNNRYAQCGVDLSVGAMVELTGRFSLYAAKGRMSFDVTSIALAGEGNLRLKVANLAKKLQNEGLMDISRKKPIPQFPMRIGLVTSPRGDAIHDVLRTLRRRFPLATVFVAGVPVEGVNAPENLIQGLREAYRADVEVILLVRGGGSFEDLMPFNDEGLARAMAKCPTPIVTGIGHEPDTSIADMVADLRASTPTAAAEAVSPGHEAIERLFELRKNSLDSAIASGINTKKTRVERIAEKPIFADPANLFATDAMTLDFTRARLEQVGSQLLAPFEHGMQLNAARLESLSPLGVLGRGYSMTTDAAGKVVKSIDAVECGDTVTVGLSDGDLVCDVKDTVKIDGRMG